MILKIDYNKLKNTSIYRFILVGVCCFDCDTFESIEIKTGSKYMLKKYLEIEHNNFLRYYHVFIIDKNYDLKEVINIYEKK